MRKAKNTAFVLSVLSALLLTAYGPVQNEGMAETDQDTTEQEQMEMPALSVNSTIFGSADTGN